MSKRGKQQIAQKGRQQKNGIYRAKVSDIVKITKELDLRMEDLMLSYMQIRAEMKKTCDEYMDMVLMSEL